MAMRLVFLAMAVPRVIQVLAGDFAAEEAAIQARANGGTKDGPEAPGTEVIMDAEYGRIVRRSAAGCIPGKFLPNPARFSLWREPSFQTRTVPTITAPWEWFACTALCGFFWLLRQCACFPRLGDGGAPNDLPPPNMDVPFAHSIRCIAIGNPYQRLHFSLIGFAFFNLHHAAHCNRR